MNNLKEALKKLELIMILGCLLFSVNALAGTFTPPQEITYSDKLYKLAYKNVLPNGRAIYEYTTNNESVEKWTSLVTLNYAKGLNVKPDQWLEAMKKQLKNDGVLSNQALYEKENSGYARFIFPPNKAYPDYESNIQKSLHVEACGGALIFQYANKYPKDTELATLLDENEKASQQMEVNKWTPDCK